MRVLFTVWPNPSHLYPVVPLAWALRSAGHEVCVAAHPEISETIAATGLTAVPLGNPHDMPVPAGPGRAYTDERAKVARVTDELDLDAADRELWDTFSQFMLPAMWDFHPYDAPPGEPRPAMDALVAFTRSWRPDLVLWDPCFPGAAVAARDCGSAHARLITAPDWWGWSVDRLAARTAAGAAPGDDPLTRTLGPVAERYGQRLDDELIRGQWTVSTLSEAMSIPVSTPTVRVRWVPFSGQTVMPHWLHPAPERPRVGLSLGLSWRKYLEGGWDHVPELLDAVSTLDIEVVATLNAKQLAGVTRLPDNVRTVDYLPLDQLVPTCSALIHHGGLATYSAAASLNVPQLITDTPEADVQAVQGDEGMGATKHAASPVSVRQVLARGAGLVLDIASPSSTAMRAQISRVLEEPSFREGAARLREEHLAMPSPHDTVPVLEKLTAQRSNK
ncbi:nucleotide disphospho-sugar-binding domain-containing protein [Streptomyces sp. NPDC057545]|uniref:nucleotide disphospho-sugar-binding domain-containing protein n=1 Tax=unclassified Streptomyces TaxID=2593676 RepID=UPI002922E1E5|nr:glycosyltransferase [Streptomyces sp.]